MSVFGSRLALRYVLGEMIPTFFIGVVVFVVILLMFQALRLTELLLVHGVKISTVLSIMGYLSTSFLPLLFPMSLLFTVLMTYGRLSSDSEIVAFKASGMSMPHILAPALVLSILVGLLSAQMAFHVAPWGNRQFEVLITKIGSQRPGMTVKEGTFSEGFFDLVVYANKVDSKTGKLSQVFIYDERDPKTPVTVIAREGRLMLDSVNPGSAASLRLMDGNIHRSAAGRHTRVDFKTTDIFLSDPVQDAFKKKSPQSFTIDELKRTLDKGEVPEDERRRFSTEYHKRWAISFACILFALIGAGLGTTSNRRSVRSGGMAICLGLIVGYWVIYVAGEGMAKSGTLPPGLSMWLANFVFMVATIFALRRAWT